MIKISLDPDEFEFSCEVAGAMDAEVMYNPNLSGAEYEVVRGDHTCIDGVDEITGAQLMQTVRCVIEECMGFGVEGS